MSQRRTLAAVSLSAACALLVGCVADRVSGLRAPDARPVPTASGNANGCPFTVKSIEDRRDDKSLGNIYHTKVAGEGFADWFANGLAAIPGHTTGESRTELRVEVLKAYITGLNTLKSANLVVRVHATAAGGAPKVTTYRAVDGSINWSSTQNEVQEAFDRALSDLQRQLGEDLSRACKS